MNLSFLTESLISQNANGASYDKGYHYYQQGYVHAVVVRGNQIQADVAGSSYQPYHVEIEFSDSDIESADCSCPYDWGGYCKHIVAVLLTCMKAGDSVEEKPPLLDLLLPLSLEQLRYVLIAVTPEFPSLAEALEREIKWLQTSPVSDTISGNVHVDVAAIRRELRKDLSHANDSGGGGSYDYFGEYEEEEIYPDEWLVPHLQTVATLLDASEVKTAVKVITAVVEEWIEGILGLEDWIMEYNQDPISEATGELAVKLAEVLLSLDMSAEERAEWQKQLRYWESQLGEFEITATAVRHGWDYAPLVAAMQGHITHTGAWGDEEIPYSSDDLAKARLRILARQQRYQEYIHLAEAEGQISLYINMLARQGETAKAVQEAKQYLTHPSDILTLCHILQEAGETEAALEIGEHGLTLESNHSKGDLARWLRDQAIASHQPALALQAAQTAFSEDLLLNDYQNVQELAGDQWLTIKPTVLASMSDSWNTTRHIDIYLYEGMLREAMSLLDKHPHSSDLMRVVEATSSDYPDWGIQKYKNQAEGIMDAGKAKYYDTAVSWLSKAREIYQSHDRLDEWRVYLDHLLDTHGRKYKLVPMLKQIR
jgi:uncharacterized Zn finger protein